MGQLHQTLAVENSKLITYKKLVEEGIATLSNKDHLFKGLTVVQKSYETDHNSANYTEYPDKTEQVPVQETVMGKLAYIKDAAIEYYDLVAQKDEANTRAKADLIVNGETLISNVPATTLLFLENKLKGFRALIEAAKTLDGAKIWTPRENGIYAAPEDTKVVKVPVKSHQSIAPATDKHQALVVEVINQVEKATRTSTELSGLITSAAKSNLLKRIDTLINAAKSARQTANNVDVANINIANKIFDYLLK